MLDQYISIGFSTDFYSSILKERIGYYYYYILFLVEMY